MTHLKIEQGNNFADTEVVSTYVISKLYEFAQEELDENSNLKGRLSVPVTYREQVEFLTAKYPDLIIIADDYAIPFEDPKMLSYLTSLGIGSDGMITESLAAAATIVANSTNTEITKFNELRYFTNITESRGGWYDARFSGYVQFHDWTALEEVDISNFTSIGHDSGSAWGDTFSGCTSLKTVISSDKLFKIGYRAFYNCTNLELITGLSGVIEVASFAFFNCKKLTDAVFLDVEFLVGETESSFHNCTGITNLRFSENSEYLKKNICRGCTNLLTVDLGGITRMSDGCNFEDCTSLLTIDLTNFTRLGWEEFKGCTNLEYFNGPDSTVGELNLSNLTHMGNDCFNGCSKLTSITSLGSITTLYSGSFMNCSNLQSVNLSNVNTFDGGWQFYKCTNLHTILNAPSVLYLKGGNGGKWSFSGCSNLVFPDEFTIANTEHHCIQEGMFYKCDKLKKVILDSSINTIYNRCFEDSGLTELEGTENIITLGSSAFRNCSNLTGTLNFSNCTGLDGLAYVFSNCTGIQKLIFGDMSKLGKGDDWSKWDDRAVFYNCTSLTTIDVKSLLTFPNYTNAVFKNTPNMANFIIRSSTVPTLLHSDQTLVIEQFGSSNVNIYVPDDAVDTYKNTEGWENVASYIKPLSEYVE